jgi:cysteine desulfurase
MAQEKIFYLDHCGTTPLSADVKNKLRELINHDEFGNPSASHHILGKAAESLVNESRAAIAESIGARTDEIIFTGSATEANNMVLWGHALRFQGRNPCIFFGTTEHKSIYETCVAIGDSGLAKTEELSVLPDGKIDLDQLEVKLRAAVGRPVLVALMHINNEIPVRHPVEQIAALCRQNEAFFHCDGVQGFVREELNFSAETFGSYVISPHKVYGPKGAGILVLGHNELSPRIKPAYSGGDQEFSLRPGTHNTLAIAAAATALTSHKSLRPARVEHMHRCAEEFVATLTQKAKSVKLTLPMQKDAAGIVNFYAHGLDAPTLLEEVSHVCINRGSSCLGAHGEKFSHVPKALGLPVEIQANVLRASFGEMISPAEASLAAEILAAAIEKIKSPNS